VPYLRTFLPLLTTRHSPLTTHLPTARTFEIS
jgi:hypothetical protein